MLEWAASRGLIRICRLLIDRGADIDPLGGPSPLCSAAVQGHAEIVRLLLDQPRRLDIEGHDSWTPLHEACQKGYFETASVLVSRGANVNALTPCGRTPLHLACSGVCDGSLGLVKLLLDQPGVIIDAFASPCGTPLHCAVWHRSSKTAALLLARGADVNATMSYPADGRILSGAIKRVDLDAPTREILAVYVPDLCGRTDLTPLHLACRINCPQSVSLLCDAGANREARDSSLEYAALAGSEEALRTLLRCGANPRSRASNGIDVLNMINSGMAWFNNAAKEERIREMLLRAGATKDTPEVDAPSSSGDKIGALRNELPFADCERDERTVEESAEGCGEKGA
ncbi:ankyrin [Schizophyllum commune H4-8]|uniref:Uncharacterized protein n=1 Tax=Schizophyllum commune (strain H4-8 / FGSC 9210) TaxID=578458 RepID=D8QMB2_SCHCM|nr:ankyrin [Schizophyllum commune H4-8]KAI5836629.1 ankyrin [Schizophyllum commune H4-8]